MVPIAIVGVSALLPGANNVLKFWRNVVQKKDLIREVPPTHWSIDDYYDPDPATPDKSYCKRGAFLDPVDFDYREFGIPPNNLNATDTTQLLALIAAKHVLDDATNGNYASMDLSRVGVILGVTNAQELSTYVSARLQTPVLAKSLHKHGIDDALAQEICDTFKSAYVSIQENTFPGLLGNIVAGRIANRFNLGGTNCVVDAACASSLAGLAMAAYELSLHKCDMMITGGADTLNDPFSYVCFSKTPALSLTGDCRPFSQDADGILLGEGLAFFVLKRLDDAERDGDQIYAVIKGIGSASDGRSKSIYAPVAEGQSNAILNAYQSAGYTPDTVELIEAHGTATKAGDVAEFNGLRMAFQHAGDQRKNDCAIGSIKSQIGHTKGAAGAASLLKTVLALHHKVLPPSIKINQVNPQLQTENTPFYFNSETRPWINGHAHPRRAGVSSFGFGGTNFHVTVEEYLGPGKRPRLLPAWTDELIVFSADTPENLLKIIITMRDEVPDNDDYLTYIARTSQLQINTDLPVRLAIVASNNDDLRKKLAASIQHIKQSSQITLMSAQGIYYSQVNDKTAKIAFLFPGQGSQYVNMGKDITSTFSPVRHVWDEFAKSESTPDNRLAKIVFPNPVFNENNRIALEKTLTATENAQPALGLTNIAMFTLIKCMAIKPDYIAGHSFGEIAALCAAGAYHADDMMRIAKKRGEVMALAGKNNEPGAMLAVVCSPDEISSLLAEMELPVTIANYNSPKQITLSGSVQAINTACEKFNERKITCYKLPVSGAFHSRWMEPYAGEFLEFLQTIPANECQTPVYSNATGEVYTSTDSIKQTLAQQLYQPVQFQKIIESMYENGVRIFVETGPGSVLTKLVQQCLPDKPIHTIALDKKGENGITQLWNGLAKLFIAGVNPDFNVVWSEYTEIESPAITEPNPYAVKITGTCNGKPYPEIFENINNETEIKVQEIERYQPVKEVNTVMTQVKNNAIDSSIIQNTKLQLFERFQQQTSDVQNTYQKLMLESHLTYLKTTENTLNALLGMGTDLQTNHTTLVTENVINGNLFSRSSTEEHHQIAAPNNDSLDNSLLTYYNAEPESVSSTPKLNVITTAPSINLSDESQIKTILLKTISEKTGYPVDMLNMDMSLEADLGIDSIKRVEILAGLQEHMPNMPEADPAMISTLRTLNEISRFISDAHAGADQKKSNIGDR